MGGLGLRASRRFCHSPVCPDPARKLSILIAIVIIATVIIATVIIAIVILAIVIIAIVIIAIHRRRPNRYLAQRVASLSLAGCFRMC